MRLYIFALLATGSVYAAGLDGTFTGAIVRFGDPQFSRVVLKTTGDKLTGTWGGTALEGTLRGTTVEISYGQNKLTGTLAAASAAGTGQIQVQGARENVTWSVAPEKTNSGPAKT
jgi:hypothetical protein